MQYLYNNVRIFLRVPTKHFSGKACSMFHTALLVLQIEQSAVGHDHILSST
jgi:hypothetical protein